MSSLLVLLALVIGYFGDAISQTILDKNYSPGLEIYIYKNL